ncbi:SWIM zinc finger family protein [Bacillus sp. IITD106]|nr:SWIM zinc finger family protein [Bacillus sp. IITD106]
MNLNNFTSFINKTILERGYDYYIEGNIIDTYMAGNNEYIFTIEGSDDYEVIVKLGMDDDIVFTTCDCPYDLGPFCKHQVAAFFELQELINSNEIHKIEKQPLLKEVLNHLSKEELIDLIEEIAKKDSVLKNNIIFKYGKSKDNQELENCNKLIKSIVNKYTGRQGFITYRETYGFTNELAEVLEKAKNIDNPLLSLDISFLLLNEAIAAFQYADDSDGEIGALVTETIEQIRETATSCDHLDIANREKAFNKILIQTDNDVFDGWEEFMIDLLGICTEFADLPLLRTNLKMKIEDLLDSGYTKYYKESLLHILFEMTEKYGTREEAAQFIQENLMYTSFRETLIKKHLKEQNYQKVIELALDGEDKDKHLPGLISKWKKLRYTAYKRLSLKAEQEKLAKDLLFSGDFEYYFELKELVEGDKKAFYHALIQELKEEKSWHAQSIYLHLIEEENDLEEMMEVVKLNPHRIEEYADKLLNTYKDDVIDIYKKYILGTASSASNRKEYQRVCSKIKKYKKIAGNERKEELRNELKLLYGRKPAFIDELGKIK